MTPEKTALIPIYREQWRAIGLSIAPIDRPKRQRPSTPPTRESIQNRKSKILKPPHLSVESPLKSKI
ncbi:hypothetical protein [Microcoleus sp. Z1_B2]|uniref:hypothetical protein n=1 Tax=Microcoleus sp. Z1_B2 TaxID=3055429 RepID=UPI003B15496B